MLVAWLRWWRCVRVLESGRAFLPGFWMTACGAGGLLLCPSLVVVVAVEFQQGFAKRSRDMEEE